MPKSVVSVAGLGATIDRSNASPLNPRFENTFDRKVASTSSIPFLLISLGRSFLSSLRVRDYEYIYIYIHIIQVRRETNGFESTRDEKRTRGESRVTPVSSIPGHPFPFRSPFGLVTVVWVVSCGSK